MLRLADDTGSRVFIPKLQYSTDNAAMIAIAGYFKYLEKDFASQDITPYSKSRL
jgi:N6-L-threonylcarbamoyladenine synthase